jgi:hypothetical protein
MAANIDTRIQATITEVDGMTNGGTITNDKPRISGKAEPFATVDVHDGTTLLGVVSANGEGSWSLQLNSPLFDGIHDLAAEQASGYGAKRSASYFAITVNAVDAQQMNETEHSAPLATESHAQSALPYFPPNVFKAHATRPDANGLPSQHDAPLYERHTLAHGEGARPFDTVALLGDHRVLDLSAVSDRSLSPHLPGIGGFDLGGHHNALRISLADALHLGEPDLFIDDGKQQLMVSGKSGDSVSLTTSHIAGLSDGHWQHHGTAEIHGVMYNVIEHSTAHTELLVEHAVRIELH